MKAVAWIEEVGKDNVDTVGGKGASLGEMEKKFPVPDGFIVTTEAYREFLEQSGIGEDLIKAANEENAEKARELILEASMPKEVEDAIKENYSKLNEGRVAVRSSATAEDLPDASFAGQQETFLEVEGEDEVIKKVKECWSSLFTDRAVVYRVEKGFSHDDVEIAVVVQRMVDADKSGVLFSSDPSTGEEKSTIEATWGLGESVVGGGVTPDNYVIDKENKEIISKKVGSKKKMFVRSEDKNKKGMIEKEVPEEKRKQEVLTKEEILELVEIGENLEAHYGTPQDVEWAIDDDGEIYVVQSRPITTINKQDGEKQSTEKTETEKDKLILKGLGASPGKKTGKVKIVKSLDELDKVEKGDVLVTEKTTPDMVPAMKKSVAIITDEGGLTSHAAIVSRELGKVAVVGTGDATKKLKDKDYVLVDGDRGRVEKAEKEEKLEDSQKEGENKIQKTVKTQIQEHNTQSITGTEVRVNVSLPGAAKRAASSGADGVGLLRLEHMILELGKTPKQFIEDQSRQKYVSALSDGIRKVAEAFYPRPVRIRTLDAPTDEFRNLEGGKDEPIEDNPMLGYRGIRRSLREKNLFKLQLKAFKELENEGYDNLELMLPLIRDGEETEKGKEIMDEVGLDIKWGVMVETPASALVIDDIIEKGVDFVSFGTNDLTQYTLAVDRNNEKVADLYNEMHPAVLKLISNVIQTCREENINTGICGEAGSRPEMAEFLVKEGVDSISANIDAVANVRKTVERMERRLLLDGVR